MDIINNLSIKGKLLVVILVGLAAFAAALISGQTVGGIVFLIVTVLAVIVWLIVTFLVSSSLTTSIQRVIQATDAMAEGNLNINFKRQLAGELGDLEESMASLSDSLRIMQTKEMETDQLLKQNEAELIQIKTSFKDLESNILGLSADFKNLTISASSGELEKRIDVSKYQDNLAVIAGCLNNLLDSTQAPINEALEVMDKALSGDFSKSIIGDYHGDFGRIKNSINGTISNTSRCIMEITRILTELAQKNLNLEIKGAFIGDFTAIKDALEMIFSQFNDVMQGVNIIAEQVALGAKAISDSSMTLAEGASMQAITVDNLTEIITQVDEKTASNAENAARAEVFSSHSHDNAIKGNNEMQNMLEAMDGIKESSNAISNVIRVISDIAFQTSMLALNASVEAARAGEHGRGFAVVAEEVRNLALKSDEAAKETTTLVEEAILKVNQGTSLATSTAQALEKIVSDTNEESAIISGIAAESHEQAEAIRRVNTDTNQIAEVIQRNSSTSEENAAASEELSSQSETLRQMIGVFRLLENSGKVTSKPAPSISPPSPPPAITKKPVSAPKPAVTPIAVKKQTPAAAPKVSNTSAVVAKPKAAAKAVTPKAVTPPTPKPAKPPAVQVPATPAASGQHLDPTSLAAKYMAESRKMVKESSEEDKKAVRTAKPAVGPNFSQGMVTSNATGVPAPSASHVYDRKDYGKY